MELNEPVTLNDHIRGKVNAPITLLEYADYLCPQSADAYRIIKHIQAHFGAQVRFVFRNYCLVDIHPLSEVAAETAEFAGAHKRFWEMHDIIFENQARISMNVLLELALNLNLSVEELKEAFVSRPFLAKIRNDLLSGVNSGVKRTPQFFINNKMHKDPFSYPGLVNAIQNALNAHTELK